MHGVSWELQVELLKLSNQKLRQTVEQLEEKRVRHLSALRLSASRLHSHSHTLILTCCYDVINGIQDLKIYSHADSPLWLSASLLAASLLSPCGHTLWTLMMIWLQQRDEHVMQEAQQDLATAQKQLAEYVASILAVSYRL